ncbi:MAG: 16S rRNA processing protein RimM [Candidatus Solibacter usitatus]|nr:16S rRNA processing protein RimM [Candidatus Solibacter usitatus]
MMTLATIVRPRGIKGEVVAEPGAWQASRLTGFSGLTLEPGGRAVELENAWDHKGRLVLKFRGIDSMTAAESLRGLQLQAPQEERPPAPDGEFYVSDLTGCRVVEHGKEIGEVTGAVEYGGPMLLTVKLADGREAMIPFTTTICVQIDMQAKRIDVRLPEGLLDL